MQAYGRAFSRVYNTKWAGFAGQVAPLILDFYASTPTGKANEAVLDLCCGAGHLAVHFLENGYSVVGLDLSESMLEYARENTGRFSESGQARFVKADAGDFTLTERFGLVVSTYDSLNHLESEQTLISCFKCVREVSSGYFIFDINTRKGLRSWNNTRIDDSSEDALIINRGFFDGQGDRALMRITGFVRLPDGCYERFEEIIYNTVFELKRVRAALLDVGWKKVYFAGIRDLSTPLTEPEEESRVFVVARV